MNTRLSNIFTTSLHFESSEVTDRCVNTSNTPDTFRYADFKYFPSGTLKPLADYVHSKGMKFGTYTDRGTKTCAGRPGALGHEVIDANTYAEWGVDYLKEDSCNAVQDHDTAFGEYGNMTKALNATGRPIFFSLCGWNDWCVLPPPPPPPHARTHLRTSGRCLHQHI